MSDSTEQKASRPGVRGFSGPNGIGPVGAQGATGVQHLQPIRLSEPSESQARIVGLEEIAANLGRIDQNLTKLVQLAERLLDRP